MALRDTEPFASARIALTIFPSTVFGTADGFAIATCFSVFSSIGFTNPEPVFGFLRLPRGSLPGRFFVDTSIVMSDETELTESKSSFRGRKELDFSVLCSVLDERRDRRMASKYPRSISSRSVSSCTGAPNSIHAAEADRQGHRGPRLVQFAHLSLSTT
jgi:hypothetical protein